LEELKKKFMNSREMQFNQKVEKLYYQKKNEYEDKFELKFTTE